jgi:hypothetical protein
MFVLHSRKKSEISEAQCPHGTLWLLKQEPELGSRVKTLGLWDWAPVTIQHHCNHSELLGPPEEVNSFKHRDLWRTFPWGFTLTFGKKSIQLDKVKRKQEISSMPAVPVLHKTWRNMSLDSFFLHSSQLTENQTILHRREIDKLLYFMDSKLHMPFCILNAPGSGLRMQVRGQALT